MLLSLTFSRNGLMDLYQMKQQMDRTKDHISRIEESNRDFRRKIDLVRKHDVGALEHRIRLQLGLLKSDEKLYLESGEEDPKPVF